MVKKFQLKNGLKVILVESHKSPVVSVQMWVRTGSADETPALRGISHFIEHLVFKGSEKFKVGEIAATVEGSGGELNAYTSFDQTVFYVTVSKKFLPVGLEVIDEMMCRPSFDEKEIDNEREVVIEEIKRSLDSSHRQASRLLFETLYKRHPYGEPVIGYEEIIRNVSRKEIVKYYDARYGPRNMTLLVVGDFDTETLKTDIEKRFGQKKGQKVKAVKRPSESRKNTPPLAVRGSVFKENFLFLAWPAPKATHRDIAALDVLAMVLGQGDSSRLNGALRIDQNLSNYAGASLFSPQDPGFFAVSASLPPGPIGDALNAIGVELNRIATEKISEEELAKAVVNLHSEQFYTLETVDGMARKYGHYEQLFNNYKEFEKFLRQVRKLKIEDIRKVARKYLNPKQLTVCALTPEDQAASVKAEIRNWQKSFKMTALAAATKKATKKSAEGLPKVWFPTPTPTLKKHNNKFEKIVLANGAVLLLRPNFDTPVMSVKLAMRGGSRIEPDDLLGMSDLLSRSWVTATQHRNEKELMASIESMAASINAFSGRNTVGLTMSGLKPYGAKVLDLMREIFREPKWVKETLQREKNLMLEQLRIRQDNPAQLAILDFMKIIFAGHPYARDPIGNVKTLSKIGANELESFQKQMMGAGNLVFSATGHVDPKEMTAFVEELTSGLAKSSRREDVQNWVGPLKSQKTFQHNNKEQVHLVLGYPGLTLKDENRFSLQVLEAVLAGQGGRLFIELRDKNSLAYSVSPIRMEGVDAGYFGAYIGCSPDKGPKALKMLRAEFQKVKEGKISEAELRRAQRYLMGRHDIDLQKNSSMGSSLLFDEIYGIDPEESFRYAERIRAVTVETVWRVAQKLFSGAEIMSAVGPKEPWSDSGLTAAPTSTILEV